MIASQRYPEIEAAYPAVELFRCSRRKFANLVYAWCIERVPHDKIEDWNAELVDLLPWQSNASAAAEELESASFFAMQAKTGG